MPVRLLIEHRSIWFSSGACRARVCRCTRARWTHASKQARNMHRSLFFRFLLFHLDGDSQPILLARVRHPLRLCFNSSSHFVSAFVWRGSTILDFSWYLVLRGNGCCTAMQSEIESFVCVILAGLARCSWKWLFGNYTYRIGLLCFFFFF